MEVRVCVEDAAEGAAPGTYAVMIKYYLRFKSTTEFVTRWDDNVEITEPKIYDFVIASGFTEVVVD